MSGTSSDLEQRVAALERAVGHPRASISVRLDLVLAALAFAAVIAALAVIG